MAINEQKFLNELKQGKFNFDLNVCVSLRCLKEEIGDLAGSCGIDSSFMAIVGLWHNFIKTENVKLSGKFGFVAL